MKKQNRIIEQVDLLDENGIIINPGYATEPLWIYNRDMVKASKLRIKEWDYYYILNEDFGITVTLSDLGYAGLFAICWLDFKTKTYKQYDAIKMFSMHKTGFHADSDSGIVDFKSKNLSIREDVKKGMRRINIDCSEFSLENGSKGLKGELVLKQDPEMESMVIATPWRGNPRAFYYNRKINCMPASGEINIGDRNFQFKPDLSFAGLDWGRGYWTYINRWYWSSASGLYNGEPFGWNLGYGFSDRSSATENMLFYKGKAHKLDEVNFHMDTSDYLKPWKFSSSDGRFEMDFYPEIDRYSNFNLLLIKSLQHQVFGRFSGTAVLDDGRKLQIKNFPGFAEDVYNRW